MRFDLEKARSYGYSDDEIAEHLGRELGFDAKKYLTAGYSSAELFSHFQSEVGLVFDSPEKNAQRGQTMARLRDYDNAITGDGQRTRRAETEGMDPRDLREERRRALSPTKKQFIQTTDAWGRDTGGVETEVAAPELRDPTIRINETDLPDQTALSTLTDAVAASVNIVPTAAKGMTDIARMVTGDADWAKGASNWIEKQKLPYSERGELQKAKFEQDMADPNVSVLDTISNNKAALLDMGIETVGSMFLPTGVAVGVVKAAGGLKAWRALSAVQRAARLERAAKAASISTAAVQNAADTFGTIRDEGGSLGDAYKGAAISGAASLAAGALTDGGVEKLIASRIAGVTAGRAAATSLGQAGIGVLKTGLKEGTQEVGEEGGNIFGESVGLNRPIDPLQAGKRIAVAGTLGTALGGVGDVATGGLSYQKPAGSPPQPTVVNFTPPGSPTQQAGLQDIVVPLPEPGSTEKGELAHRQTVVEQTPGAELLKRIPVLDENGLPVPNESLTASPSDSLTAPLTAPPGATPLGDAAAQQTESAPTSSPSPEPRTNWRSIPIQRRTDAELEWAAQHNTSPASQQANRAELERRRASRPQAFAAQQPAVQPGLAAPTVQPTGVQAPPVSPTTTPTAAPTPATAVAPTTAAVSSPPVNVTKVRERLTQIFGKNVADQVSLVKSGVVPTGQESAVGGRVEGYFLPEDGANVVLDNIGKRNNTKLDNDELATWVGAHEILHSGAFQQVADQGLKFDAEGYTTVLRGAERNPIVSKIAAQKNKANSRGVNVEEALVEIGAALETGNFADLSARYGVTFTPAATTKLGNLYQGLIAAARKVLRRIGIVKEMTDGDIRALLMEWKSGAKKFAAERAAGVQRKAADFPRQTESGMMLSEVPSGSRTASMATEAIRGGDLTRSQMNRAVRYLKGKNDAVYRNVGLRMRAARDTKGSWRQGLRDDIAGMVRSGTIPRRVIDPEYGQSPTQRAVGRGSSAPANVAAVLRERLRDTGSQGEARNRLRNLIAQPIPRDRPVSFYEKRADELWRAMAEQPGFPASGTFFQQRDWLQTNLPTSFNRWRTVNKKLNDAFAADSRTREPARGARPAQPTVRADQIPAEVRIGERPPSGVERPTSAQIYERGWHGEYAYDSILFTDKNQPRELRLRYASEELRRKDYDLFNTLTTEKAAALISGWKKILANDSAFKFKQPGELSRTIPEIARDMGMFDQGYSPEYQLVNNMGTVYHQITLTNPQTRRRGMAHLEEARSYDGDGRAFVAHTAQLNRDGLGTAWYQLAAAFALKSNVPIEPDGILLDINNYRRTEQMLASAARNGGKTTMIPHRTQRVYGFVRPQNDTDHQRNFVRLLIANVRNVEELFPPLKHVEYDHTTDKFKFRNPSMGADEQAEALVNSYTGVKDSAEFPGDSHARNFGLGRTTVARAALTQKILSGEPVANVAPRKPVMYSEIDEDPIIDPDAIAEQEEFLNELSKDDMAAINAELNSYGRRGRPNGAPDPNDDYSYPSIEEMQKYAGADFGIGEETGDMDIIDESARPNFVWGAFDPREDLYNVIPPEAAERIVKAWNRIASRAKSFKFGGRGRITPFPAVDARKMQELAEKIGLIDHLRRDVKSDIYSLRVTKLTSEQAKGHDGTSGFRIVFLDENGAAIPERTVDISYHPEDNEESNYLAHNGYRINVPYYVVHSIKLEKGSGVGTIVYQLIGAYADRSGVVIAPDRGLTGINQYRRTEQHVSIALRTGKPTLMLPGTNQKVYKFNPSASTPEEHAKNFVRLIVASTRNWQHLEPEIFNLRYDAKTDTFTDLNGGYADDVAREIVKRRHEDKGMGRATLARAVLNQQLLEGKRVGRPKRPLLYSEITDSVYNAESGDTDGRRDQTADARAQTGSSEPTVRPSGRSVEGTGRSIEVTGIHYSHDKRTVLYGNRFGTGIQGREQARIAQSSDQRIKRRVYFYIQNEDGVLPKKKGGLGVWAHKAVLGNLFEAGVSPTIEIDTKSKDGWPLSPGERANRFESAVLDAGYDGYVNRSGNVAVVMNKDVPVELVNGASPMYSEIELDQRVMKWWQDAQDPRARVSREIKIAPALHDAYGRAGLSARAPVYIDQTDVRHITKDRMDDGLMADVSPDDVGRLGKLLGMEPRAIILGKQKGLQVRYRNIQEAKRIEAILPARNRNGHPYLVVLERRDVRTPDGPMKVVGVITMHGRNRSAAHIAEAARDGAVVYMPEEEVDRVRTLLQGTDLDDPRLAASPQPEIPEGKPTRSRPTKGRKGTVSQPTEVSIPTRDTKVKLAIPAGAIERLRRQAAVFSDPDADRPSLRPRRFDFDIPKETWLQRQRRKVQDFMLRARVIEEVIAAQGGMVNDRTSVYRAHERLPGRIQSEMIRFRDEFLRPLSEKLAAKELGYDDLALYAYAKHAKERNAHIQTINPKFAGTNNGSGMTDDQADMILQIFDHEGLTQTMEDLHRDLMALTESTRRVLLDEGLIDQESYDNWTSLYQNYVPLRGFENIEVNEQGIPKFRTGRGVNVRGNESVRALGRRSQAGQIVENIILDYERAIIRTERNAVARILADLVLNNPDPTLWEINAERKQRSFDKQRHAVVTTYVTDKGEDTVGLKIDGQPVYIKIKDPLLARALRQSFMDETGQFQRGIYEAVGWYTNFIRNTLTRYNPGFMLVNGIRDFETGSVSVLDKLGAKAVATYAKHYKGAMAASYRYEMSKLDPGAREWDKWFREYADAGGITGGFFMRDADAVMDELRAELIDAGGSVSPKGGGMNRVVDAAWIKTRGSLAGKLASKTLRAVELLGSVSENASRVAAYRTAREMGKSPAEASRIAKNLTTNFNRKGEWGTALSSLYLFFNAAMQGGMRVLYALKNPKVQAAMAGFTGLSMALALANADWGGEDDDGVRFWDKLSDDEKERNLIIMLPPKDGRARYTKIPMAYGYNVFAVLGNAFADSLRYTQDPKHGKPYAKSAINMMSAVMGSFNPVSGSFDPTDPKKLALAVSPTFADLAVNIATETNSWGEPAAPERDDRYPRPDSERFFLSQAGTTQQRIARWMNEVSGGNQAQSGSIDVTPATISTVVRGATGGTGVFVMDVINTLAQLTDSTQEVNPRNVPFFKSLHGTSDERLTSRQFYENQREISDDYRQLMMAMKAGIKVDFEDPKNRALVMLGKHMDAVGEQMTNIRKWEIQIIEDPKLTDKEKELKRKEVRAVREKLMKDYNKQFAEVWGGVR